MSLLEKEVNMGNIGVIHEDVCGFGDGLGFQALNEADNEKLENSQSAVKTLHEKSEGEPTKNK